MPRIKTLPALLALAALALLAFGLWTKGRFGSAEGDVFGASPRLTGSALPAAPVKDDTIFRAFDFVGGKPAAADAQKTLDGLKDKAPAEVQTDLEYLGDQLSAIREAPDQAAREQIANSQEFQDAVKRLGEYVKRECEQG